MSDESKKITVALSDIATECEVRDSSGNLIEGVTKVNVVADARHGATEVIVTILSECVTIERK